LFVLPQAFAVQQRALLELESIVAQLPCRKMAQEAAKDVEALERILHRLVMTPDDKLAGVLAKLLPKLLEKLNNAEATLVRPKVIELLSHISKRARPNTSITLPCEELLSLCLEAQAGPMTRNFAMVYLEMGLPRASNEEQSQVAVGLMQGISLQARFSAQHSLRLHLLATVLNNLKLSQRESSNGSSTSSSSSMLTTAVQPLQDADAADVMDWFFDVALYRGSSKRDTGAAAVAVAAQPGLSAARLARLELRGQLAPPLLLARKLYMVRALKCDLFKPAVTVAPALAAACDTHHEVVAKAEDLLRSISSADRQGHVASDSALATHLLSLLLGDTTRAPVSAAVSVRCLNWLTAECPTGLANAAEVGAKVVTQCLLSVHPSAATDRTNAARMRAGSARLAAFLAARCSDTALHSIGEALLHAAVVTLQQNGDPPGDSPTTVDQQAVAAVAGTALVLEQQRSATLEASYEVIAALAVRAPALALRDVAMLRQLFADIGTRESELRVRVAAALGALREAYKAAATAAGGSQQGETIYVHYRQYPAADRVAVLLQCLTASTVRL
jgi:Proteasome stabiliser